MLKYSPQDRVDLTALGWLFVAEAALAHTGDDDCARARHEKQAGTALESAIRMIETAAVKRLHVQSTRE